MIRIQLHLTHPKFFFVIFKSRCHYHMEIVTPMAIHTSIDWVAYID